MTGASRNQKGQVVDKKDTCQNLALVVDYPMANLSIVNGCCIHDQQVPSFALHAHYSQAHALIFPHLDSMTGKMLQNVYKNITKVCSLTPVGKKKMVSLTLYF